MADHEANPAGFGKIVTDPSLRRWIYGVGAAIILLLQVQNILNPEQAHAWSNVLSAVVALGTAGLAIPNTPKG